jgi:hypothetical protein
MYLNGAPDQGTNATITLASAFTVAGTTSLTAAAATASMAITIPQYTVTMTGATNVTGIPGVAGILINQITINNATAASQVDYAASLLIKDAPTSSGQLSLTNTYAIFVDAGISRFDGDGTDVFELPADATDPTGGGGAATGRIPVKIGGATVYLAYY